MPNIHSSYFDNCFQFIFLGLCSSPVSVIKVPEGKMLPRLQMWQVIQDWPIKASHFPGGSNLFPVIPWPRSGQSKPETLIWDNLYCSFEELYLSLSTGLGIWGIESQEIFSPPYVCEWRWEWSRHTGGGWLHPAKRTERNQDPQGIGSCINQPHLNPFLLLDFSVTWANQFEFLLLYGSFELGFHCTEKSPK